MSRLETIKQRMRSLNEQIDDKETEISDLKLHMKDKDEEFDKLEEDNKSLHNRLKILENNLDDTEIRLADTNANIDALSTNMEESRESLALHTNKEGDSDTKLENLENALKEATRGRDDAQVKLSELENRARVLEKEINRTEDKNDTLRKTQHELEEIVANATGQIKELEHAEAINSNNEEINEEKIRVLQSENKSLEVETEANGNMINTLNRALETAAKEVEVWEEKRDNTTKELDLLSNESFDDIE